MPSSVSSQGTSQVLPDFSSASNVQKSSFNASNADDQSFDQVLSSQQTKNQSTPKPQSAHDNKHKDVKKDDSKADAVADTAENTKDVDQTGDTVAELDDDAGLGELVSTSQTFDENRENDSDAVSNKSDVPVDPVDGEAHPATTAANAVQVPLVQANSDPDTSDNEAAEETAVTSANPVDQLFESGTEATNEETLEVTSTVKEDKASDDVNILAATQVEPQIVDHAIAQNESTQAETESDVSSVSLSGQTNTTASNEVDVLNQAGSQPQEEQLTSEEQALPQDFSQDLKLAAQQAQTTKDTATDFKTSLETAKPVEMSIARPVTSDGWGDKVFERIQWMANADQQKAEIRLDPPDLGPLKIEVTIKNDAAQVTMTSHSSVVRDILDQNLPRLRDALESQGFQSVDAQTRDGQQESSGQQSRDQRLAALAQGGEEEIQQGTIIVENSGKGRVDCYI